MQLIIISHCAANPKLLLHLSKKHQLQLRQRGRCTRKQKWIITLEQLISVAMKSYSTKITKLVFHKILFIGNSLLYGIKFKYVDLGF